MNNMLSSSEEKLLDLLINNNKASVYLKYMIINYAKSSLINANELLEYNNEILKIINNEYEKTLKETNTALHMSIVKQSFDKSDVHSYFAIMVPICKIKFPNGVTDSMSISEKNYFNEFIELYRNKKAFNWNSQSDVEWAKSYNYIDYLKSIYDKYIIGGKY